MHSLGGSRWVGSWHLARSHSGPAGCVHPWLLLHTAVRLPGVQGTRHDTTRHDREHQLSASNAGLCPRLNAAQVFLELGLIPSCPELHGPRHTTLS